MYKNNENDSISPIHVITGNHLDEELVSTMFKAINDYELKIGDNVYKLGDYIETDTNTLEKNIIEEYNSENKISFVY